MSSTLASSYSDLTLSSASDLTFLRSLLPSALGCLTLSRLTDADSLSIVQSLISGVAFDGSVLCVQELFRSLISACSIRGDDTLSSLPVPFNAVPHMTASTLELIILIYQTFPAQPPPQPSHIDYTLQGVGELIAILPEEYKKHATIPLLQNTQTEDREDIIQSVHKQTITEYIQHCTKQNNIQSEQEAHTLANALWVLREIEDDIQCIPQMMEWIKTRKKSHLRGIIVR
jgi:hypothetical protein